jgi:hypothetical protein
MLQKHINTPCKRVSKTPLWRAISGYERLGSEIGERPASVRQLLGNFDRRIPRM